MMQFIPFSSLPGFAATGLLPALKKWYPDGIQMMPTWLQNGPGE